MTGFFEPRTRQVRRDKMLSGGFRKKFSQSEALIENALRALFIKNALKSWETFLTRRPNPSKPPKYSEENFKGRFGTTS